MRRSMDPGDSRSPTGDANLLQTVITESAADELTRRLNEPFKPSKTDLINMVFRGASVLSTMAAELGVILRIQIRGEGISISVDEEKLRRALNALVIHLLTVSQSGGWVTIGLEEKPADGRRGFTLRLTADKIVLPRTSIPEFEEELNTQAELSLCRKIVEKHGGILGIQFQDENKLTFSVWLPA